MLTILLEGYLEVERGLVDGLMGNRPTGVQLTETFMKDMGGWIQGRGGLPFAGFDLQTTNEWQEKSTFGKVVIYMQVCSMPLAASV